MNAAASSPSVAPGRGVALPPALFIAFFSLFHVANMINAIGLSMHAKRQFEATDYQIGLLGFFPLLAYALAVWAGGIMADRFPKRALMAGGLILLAAGSHMIPRAPSLGWLYAIAALCSVVQIAIFPPFFGLIADAASPRRISSLLGFAGFSLVGCALLGAAMVGRLYENLGPPATFRMSVGFVLGSALFVSIFRPRRADGFETDPKAAPSEAEASGLAPLARRRFLYASLALNFTCFFVAWVNQQFLVKIAGLPEINLSLSDQSTIHGLRMVGGLTGYATASLWSGWHWRRWPFFALGGYLTVMALGAGLAPGPVALGVAIGLSGFATAVGNQMSLFYCVGSGIVGRGTGAGLTETALALGGSVGSLLAGQAAAMAGTPRAALLAPLVPLAICLAAWALLLRDRPGEPPPAAR